MKPRDKDRSGVFRIGAIAERYGIHPQTLRMYEREGLLRPARTEGNTRLYDNDTIERLEIILTLTRHLGVNLAGVEVILHMKQRLESKGMAYESRQVPGGDLWQIFVDDPNGVMIELNYEAAKEQGTSAPTMRTDDVGAR